MKWRSEHKGKGKEKEKRKGGERKNKERGREKRREEKKEKENEEEKRSPTAGLEPRPSFYSIAKYLPLQSMYHISIAYLDFDDLAVAALTPPIMS